MFRKRDPLHFGVQFKTSESFFCYVLGMMPRFIRGGVDVKRENSRKVILKKDGYSEIRVRIGSWSTPI